jgi:Cu+-exporting ATPase
VIALADTLKPESAEAVAQLQALGLEVWMLAGDNRAWMVLAGPSR